MKKRLFKSSLDWLRNVLRQAVSPTFLVILLGAALLWYTSKLSYDYTTEMEMGIRVDGQKYLITAEVRGRGSAILARQLHLKSPLGFTLDELSPRPSRRTEGALTFTPALLQRALNGRMTDLVIVQVTDAPDFLPLPEGAEAAGSGSAGAGSGSAGAAGSGSAGAAGAAGSGSAGAAAVTDSNSETPGE